MGFYIRKSVRVGPLRFNLSNSGVGVSTGFKGFRIGTGPRGNYVHMGRNGIYYRATLPGPGSRKPRALPGGSPHRNNSLPSQRLLPDDFEAIDSVDASQMQDTSALALLDEINAKRSLMNFFPLTLVLVVALCLFAGFSSSVLFVVALLFGVPLAIFIAMRDKVRKSVVVFYDLEDASATAYGELYRTFEQLGTCSRIWHVAAAGQVADQKRNGGAAALVQRTPIPVQVGKPPGMELNLDVPCLPVGKQTMYFLPDTILVFDQRGVGAVGYDQIEAIAQERGFIESEAVPSDASILGSTWQYVNKNGGPDRRFGNNRELPICNYGNLQMRSASGLNEQLQTSDAAKLELFVRALRAYRPT